MSENQILSWPDISRPSTLIYNFPICDKLEHISTFSDKVFCPLEIETTTFSSFFIFLFISADPELVGGDTLTCGVCRKEFALADIVKFIQHKVLTCNKENYRCATENGGDGTTSSESDVDATNVGTGANSTPISRTTTPQHQPRRHSISTVTPGKASPSSDNNNLSTDVKCEDLSASELHRKKKVELVDAESNTVSTGKHFSIKIVLFQIIVGMKLMKQTFHLFVSNYTSWIS